MFINRPFWTLHGATCLCNVLLLFAKTVLQLLFPEMTKMHNFNIFFILVFFWNRSFSRAIYNICRQATGFFYKNKFSTVFFLLILGIITPYYSQYNLCQPDQFSANWYPEGTQNNKHQLQPNRCLGHIRHLVIAGSIGNQRNGINREQITITGT